MATMVEAMAVVVAAFIVLACAATLHRAGISIQTADDAAKALRPIAGSYCGGLFAIGLTLPGRLSWLVELGVLLDVLVAIMVNEMRRAKGFFRLVYFLPTVIPITISIIISRMCLLR